MNLHIHLMDRTKAGNPATNSIAWAESDADRLAFELLAPYELVGKVAEFSLSQAPQATLVHLLINTYGLPYGPAVQYASIVVPEANPPSSLLRRLGLST